MILHAFYNSKNIGDVLLVRLCDERNIDSYLRQDDVCVLKKGNKIIVFVCKCIFIFLLYGRPRR